MCIIYQFSECLRHNLYLNINLIEMLMSSTSGLLYVNAMFILAIYLKEVNYNEYTIMMKIFIESVLFVETIQFNYDV